MILAIRDLVVSYGAIRALQGVTVELAAGELVSIVGPNGAGKSSLLRAVSGLIPASGGAVIFDGQAITRTPTHKRVAMGLLQVPEGRAILQGMTVEENLRIAYEHGRETRGEPDVFAEIFVLFAILAERRHQRAGTLSGGEQQMLAIARALVARPSVLLLDEPSLGLAPLIARDVFRVIASLRERGVSILLVEQNVRAALRIADRAYVLQQGRVVAQGPAREVAARPEILGAYLGVRQDGDASSHG
jgi:branched-chain amino acid transport system ATP-binding protein